MAVKRRNNDDNNDTNDDNNNNMWTGSTGARNQVVNEPIGRVPSLKAANAEKRF